MPLTDQVEIQFGENSYETRFKLNGTDISNSVRKVSIKVDCEDPVFTPRVEMEYLAGGPGSVTTLKGRMVSDNALKWAMHHAITAAFNRRGLMISEEEIDEALEALEADPSLGRVSRQLEMTNAGAA